MKGMRSRLLTATLFLVLFAMLFSGCGGSGYPSETSEALMQQEGIGAEAVYHALTQEEAKARMDSGDSIVILDVRTQEEYAAGHIADAMLLPSEDIGTEMLPELPDKDAEILVYCNSGNRSAKAARKLVEIGYTAVYDFGGIKSWKYGIVTE